MEYNVREYLIKEGYSEYTPSGNPSNVYDYVKRIEKKTCEREGVSVDQVALKMSYYV